MKKYLLLVVIALLSMSCNGQRNTAKNVEITESEKNKVEQPKGSWKVDKEFDDRGNLIKYDSIYSWSSNGKLDNLSGVDKDSLLQSFKLRFFNNFSDFEDKEFGDMFSKDSLFSKYYFNDDFFGSEFGEDYMAIDKITQQIIAKQKSFLEKYQSEFIKPENED